VAIWVAISWPALRHALSLPRDGKSAILSRNTIGPLTAKTDLVLTFFVDTSGSRLFFRAVNAFCKPSISAVFVAMCPGMTGTSMEPESLRGPEAEIVVIDEIARMRYQQSVFNTMMLGLRLGDRPRVLIATTPRTTPFMKKLVAMDDVRITTGSTYDNADHLSAGFLKKVKELYEGTRLGRQELQGAMILDPQNALFKDDWLIHDEVAEDLIEQVTVGVDPSGGGHEVGIVASALLNDGRFAVLADRTTTGSPAQWGEAAVKCHDDFDGYARHRAKLDRAGPILANYVSITIEPGAQRSPCGIRFDNMSCSENTEPLCWLGGSGTDDDPGAMNWLAKVLARSCRPPNPQMDDLAASLQ
jgi:hypothetical protein